MASILLMNAFYLDIAIMNPCVSLQPYIVDCSSPSNLAQLHLKTSSLDLLVKEHNFETFCHNVLVKNIKKQMVSTLNLASAESTQFSLSIPILQLQLKSLKFQNLDFPTITKGRGIGLFVRRLGLSLDPQIPNIHLLTFLSVY